MTMHDHHPNAAASWNAMAAEYALKADALEPFLRAATDAILDAVGLHPGMRLLDLACGPGHATAAAARRGAEALGIDRSRAMIDAARSRHPEARFAEGDMLSPPPGAWDAVVCRFAAHHAGPGWLEATFRVLRQGGRLAIAEVEPESDAPAGHAHGKLAPREWRRRFERAGFLDVRVEPCEIEHDWPATWIISGRKPEKKEGAA